MEENEPKTRARTPPTREEQLKLLRREALKAIGRYSRAWAHADFDTHGGLAVLFAGEQLHTHLNAIGTQIAAVLEEHPQLQPGEPR